MGEACLKFDAPVTGGNVSFYNQNPDGAVYPTPTIGMVGLLDSEQDKMTLGFKYEGDSIYLIGASVNDISSSEYLHKLCGIEFSPAPHFNLDEEYAVQSLVTDLIKNKLIQSAHDISEGGLAITLLESGFHSNLGFEVNVVEDMRKDAFWFGEAQSRVVVSVKSSNLASFKQAAETASISITDFNSNLIVTSNSSVLISYNFTTDYLNNLTWKFDGTNYSLYDNSLLGYWQFNNYSSLGEWANSSGCLVNDLSILALLNSKLSSFY
jgi:phosphoribosylformylglycinamidine (FGAM) synthase-like enzyme